MRKCKTFPLFLLILSTGLVSCDHNPVLIKHEAPMPSMTNEDLSCIQRAFDQTQSFGETTYHKTSADFLNEIPDEQQIYAAINDSKLTVAVIVGPSESKVRKIRIIGSPLANQKFSQKQKQQVASVLEEKTSLLENQISIECDGKWKELNFEKTISIR